MSYNCFAEKVAKGPKRHVVSTALQKVINIDTGQCYLMMSHIADFGSWLSHTHTQQTWHPSHVTKNLRVPTCLLEAWIFADKYCHRCVGSYWKISYKSWNDAQTFKNAQNLEFCWKMLLYIPVTGIATEREQTSYCEPSKWGGTMVWDRIPSSLELSSREVP
jgi:hypothetical protein